jgi:2-oxo-4-hydroxy-4-carboxy-5-ureidoimidazoline decarboxylase
MSDGGSGPSLVGGPIPVSEFDAADPADAAAELMPCCGSHRWVTEIVGSRPYRVLAALLRKSDDVLANLDWVDVVQALTEQPGIADRAEVHRAYERKFGYVFVVDDTDLTAEQLIDAARERLTNDPFAERIVVAGELRKIVRLRLVEAFH